MSAHIAEHWLKAVARAYADDPDEAIPLARQALKAIDRELESLEGARVLVTRLAGPGGSQENSSE